MTKRNVQRGGLWMLTLVGMILLISLISLVTNLGAGGTESFAAVIRFVLGAVLLYFMYRGFAWARWLVGLLCLAGGALTFLVANSASQVNAPVSAIVVVATMACIYLASGLILLLSPSIRAFQRYQKGYATSDG